MKHDICVLERQQPICLGLVVSTGKRSLLYFRGVTSPKVKDILQSKECEDLFRSSSGRDAHLVVTAPLPEVPESLRGGEGG